MLKTVPWEVPSAQLFLSPSWTPATRATVKLKPQQCEQKGTGRMGLLLLPQGRDLPRGAEVAVSTRVPKRARCPTFVHPLSSLLCTLALLWSMPVNVLLVSDWGTAMGTGRPGHVPVWQYG